MKILASDKRIGARREGKMERTTTRLSTLDELKKTISIISHLRQHRQILLLTLAATFVSFTQCNDVCLYLISTTTVLETAGLTRSWWCVHAGGCPRPPEYMLGKDQPLITMGAKSSPGKIIRTEQTAQKAFGCFV